MALNLNKAEAQTEVEQTFDDYDYDNDLRKNYEKKVKYHFKDKSEPHKSPHIKLRNSLSDTCSRPSGQVPCTKRLAEKIINRDTELHHAIDIHLIEPKTNFYRK